MNAMDQHTSADLSGFQATLRRRLEAFGQRVRINLLLESAAWWVGIVVGLALVTFVLDRTFRLSHFTRRGLLLGFIAVVIVQAARLLLMPWRLKLKPYALASALERKAGKPIAARVASVLELPSISAHDASRAMVERAVANSHGVLSNIDFESYLDLQRRKRAIGAIAMTFLSVLLLIAIFPTSAHLWAARLFTGSDQPWPQRTFLDIGGVVDGRIVVPRGESFALRASARPESVPPETVTIHWRQGGSSENTALLTKFGDNDFRFDFPPTQTDATFTLSGGDDLLGPISIHPVDRPRVNSLKLVTRHPTDPESNTHTFSADDSGDLAFLPATQMELSFTANIPIREAKVHASSTQPAAADVRRIDDQQFAVSWQHAAASQIQIELVSADAGLESVPTSVSIGLKTDKPPRVTLGYSGVRQRVTPQATIPLVSEARDDFGVDRMELRFKAEMLDAEDPKKNVTTSTTQPVFGPSTQPGQRETEVRQPYALKVPDMKLQPGYSLTIAAAAMDAAYPQSQSGLSRQINFRVVRPEELFKEILLRQQAERAKLRKQTEEARRIKDLLSADLSSQDVALIARQHRTVQREVSRIQVVFSDSLTEMRLNVLGNADSYELMDKSIVQPMAKLGTDLMIPQRDALDTLSPANPADLAATKDRQEQIVAQMEAILKQMAQWDSFVDVLNQLNEIIRLETLVQKETSQLKTKQTEGVFDP